MVKVTGKPGSVLLGMCSSAQRLFIAAPYIKANALDTVLTSVKSINSLVCITRWRPEDIIVGVSDVGCRALVNERGGLFKLHPSLHAKYYGIDDVALVGSANLTSSAMGWALQPNVEILCHAGDGFDAHEFERGLLRDSREIRDVEFEHWNALDKIDARIRREIAGVQPPLSAWRPATREPRNLILAYRGRGEEIASFDEQRAARRDIQALLIPPGLTNEALGAWISTCLLAAPFVKSVIRLDDSDTLNVPSSLAEIHGLGATEARRDMETVQNWLSFLAPETSAETR